MNFSDVLDKVAKYSKDGTKTATERNRKAGKAFENITREFLRYNEEYELTDVWSFADFPFEDKELSRRDVGIDLIAKDKNGKFVAIQCKYYREKPINLNDIATFLTAATGLSYTKEDGSNSEIYFSRLLLAYVGRIGKEALSRIEHYEKESAKASDNLFSDDRALVPPITLIPRKIYEEFEWEGVKNLDLIIQGKGEIRKDEIKLTLRQHQIEAIDAVRKEFGFDKDDNTDAKTANRATIIMPCGSGKSLTAARLLLGKYDDSSEKDDSEKEKDGILQESEIALFLAPSISLVSQTMGVFSHQSRVEFTKFIVCSDMKAGKMKDINGNTVSMGDLPIMPTTDADKLAKNLQQYKDKRIVIFSTYQSIQVVADAMKAIDRTIKIIVCDEAHRTAATLRKKSGKDVESDFTKVHDDNNIKADFRLYMTATPKIFSDDVEKAGDREGAVKLSDAMTHDEVFAYSMDNERFYLFSARILHPL